MKPKFRAWDKTAKKWHTRVHVGSECCSSVYDEERQMWLEFDEFCGEIVQWTGLNDKNGKEVYEGDILGRKSPNTGETYYYKVEWDAENARFIVSGPTIQELVPSSLERGYEWRGNIYENAELIAEVTT